MKFNDSIKDALDLSLREDEKVLVYGLGVPDPKRIFGTTQGLQETFGRERIFDMPLSENAMTGVAIGAAIGGYKPVFVHQRLDFFLLAMDQLVNGAAKWHMMFGGQASVPITIRLIIGRGWGQGPTHSQSLHAWFAHIPGLKVVMPSNPADAKGLLMASIQDPNPVVFIEHRWLHNMEGDVPKGQHLIPIGKANKITDGDDITIIGSSILIPEAQHAISYLSDHDVKAELIDLRTVRPIDFETIFNSVCKTGKVLVLDMGAKTGSIASEIITRIMEKCGDKLSLIPRRLCAPDYAQPTSFSLTKNVCPESYDIAKSCISMLDKNIDITPLKDAKPWPHDVPGDWFSGPF